MFNITFTMYYKKFILIKLSVVQFMFNKFKTKIKQNNKQFLFFEFFFDILYKSRKDIDFKETGNHNNNNKNNDD